jgi:hypothetical protein
LKHRGWEGSDNLLFCSDNESIDHLFIQCPMAQYAWSVVQCAFDIKTNLTSVSDIIDWVFKFPTSMRKLVSVVVTTAIWAL